MSVHDTKHGSASAVRAVGARGTDLLCFSHLRWSFVYQRPQHLLSRCARARRVFFVEEPTPHSGEARMDVSLVDGVHVVVPRLPHGVGDADATLAALLSGLIDQHAIDDYALWFYTPMALPIARHLAPAAIVYDCMDELSAFRHAPPVLRERECELLAIADVVLTGGQSLYEAKRDRHENVHALPSSVDVAHFAKARRGRECAKDQASIPRPRLGFCGVIDERMDLELLGAVARSRPDWHVVVVGPVVKIDPGTLPREANIHYLGPKSYDELPSYLAGWDVALLPFARNESTRFISPTKTPEYLAAGLPVVSTSIRDVVRPYGALGFARIADSHADFIRAIELCLAEEHEPRLAVIDRYLSQMSWEKTWARANELLEAAIASRRERREIGPCSTT